MCAEEQMVVAFVEHVCIEDQGSRNSVGVVIVLAVRSAQFIIGETLLMKVDP